MPVDTSLLYGEMIGSWIIHLAIPVGVSVLLSVLPYMPIATKVTLLLVVSAILSAITQAAFLTALQASACSGVKDYRSIFIASGVGGLMTAGMMSLPLYIEPLRLLVSQLFGSHRSLLTPALAHVNNVITAASTDIAAATLQKGGAALTPVEYEAQTFREMMFGSAYWAAFAGAYGIGVGSMMATSCPAKH